MVTLVQINHGGGDPVTRITVPRRIWVATQEYGSRFISAQFSDEPQIQHSGLYGRGTQSRTSQHG